MIIQLRSEVYIGIKCHLLKIFVIIPESAFPNKKLLHTQASILFFNCINSAIATLKNIAWTLDFIAFFLFISNPNKESGIISFFQLLLLTNAKHSFG